MSNWDSFRKFQVRKWGNVWDVVYNDDENKVVRASRETFERHTIAAAVAADYEANGVSTEELETWPIVDKMD